MEFSGVYEVRRVDEFYIGCPHCGAVEVGENEKRRTMTFACGSVYSFVVDEEPRVIIECSQV